MILHRAFKKIPNVRKVYYQPPSADKLEYPCIIYQFNRYSKMSADNNPYLLINQYTATVIDSDPESCIHEYVLKDNKIYIASFDRFYIADNLYHWTFDIVLINHTDI